MVQATGDSGVGSGGGLTRGGWTQALSPKWEVKVRSTGLGIRSAELRIRSFVQVFTVCLPCVGVCCTLGAPWWTWPGF